MPSVLIKKKKKVEFIQRHSSDIHHNQNEDYQLFDGLVAMESVQSKLSVSKMTTYLGIFKEPRGLIRALQFIFAIFAFATACNGGSSVGVNVSANAGSVTSSWAYPYNLKNSPIVLNSNKTVLAMLSSSNDVKPSAEFFVFTGVTSMLLSLAFLVVYVVMDRQYRNNEQLPIVDLAVTLIWTIFWLAGSSAWAQGVTNIRKQTSWDTVAANSGVCPTGSSCSQQFSGAYANVIVSVIFGFLNFILWAGSAWFVYKETKFFKSRNAQQQQQQAQPNTNFSDINALPAQQQSQFRPTGSMG